MLGRKPQATAKTLEPVAPNLRSGVVRQSTYRCHGDQHQADSEVYQDLLSSPNCHPELFQQFTYRCHGDQQQAHYEAFEELLSSPYISALGLSHGQDTDAMEISIRTYSGAFHGLQGLPTAAFSWSGSRDIDAMGIHCNDAALETRYLRCCS